MKTRASEPVVIGHDVWVGDCVIFLPGVEVGTGAIVGAGSVVTRSIPPYTVYAGNPAKEIGLRVSPEKANELEALQWWHWSVEKMKQNKEIFMLNFSDVGVKEFKGLLK